MKFSKNVFYIVTCIYVHVLRALAYVSMVEHLFIMYKVLELVSTNIYLYYICLYNICNEYIYIIPTNRQSLYQHQQL